MKALLALAAVSTFALAEVGPPPVAPSDWFFDQHLRFRWYQAKVHHEPGLRGAEMQRYLRECKEVANEYNSRAGGFSQQLLKNRKLPLRLNPDWCE